MEGIRRAALTVLAAAIMLPVMISVRESRATAAVTSYDWLQFNGNPQHSGNNSQESSISAGNVSSLTQVFQATLPAVADGMPAYLSGVTTASGTKDLLFLNTTDGRIVVLDAHSGVTMWTKQHGPGSCQINNGSSVCYTTSSPAIDPNRQYVYSYGLDGMVHKYQVADGTEILTGGWPETTTLKGFDEKGSSALSIATAKSGRSFLYVANGGYPGDNGDYQGHITAIDLASGSQHVFNAACSNLTIHFVENGVTSPPNQTDCAQTQTAVWARSGVVYDTATDRIYIATGNGYFDPATYNWGDSVLALNPDGTGANGNPLDSYTPTNFQTLQNNDTDLGSTAPAILPAPSGSTVTNLAVQSGKDGELRLLNLDNLSGTGGIGKTGGELAITAVPQGNEVLTAPAVWVNPQDSTTWVFVANDNGVSGLQITLDAANKPTFSTTRQWTVGGRCASPLIANSILYCASDGLIRGLDPRNGNLLWQSSGIGGIHWESPVVANGVLYIADESAHLTAYAPNSPSTATLTPAPSGTPTSTPVQSTATRTNTPGQPTPTRTTTRTATQTQTPTPTVVSVSIFTTQTPTRTGQSTAEGGVKFQSSVAGAIIGLRYYRPASETGTHTGHLWSATGTLLGTVAFTNETASGWQTATFATPIAISAHTTYVASVNCQTMYATTPYGLATSVSNGPLSTIADGKNGVYAVVGVFPRLSINNMNYFRDVIFRAGA